MIFHNGGLYSTDGQQTKMFKNNQSTLISNYTIRYFCTTLIFVFVFASAVTGENLEKWFLMSRHGECAEIATLKRKVSDFPEIEDPFSFTRLMRARGHTVIERPLELPGHGAIQIDVAELSLHLIFVTSPLCKGYSEHE